MKHRLVGLATLLTVAIGLPALGQSAAPSRWPAQVNTDEGQVTFFQPQLEDLQAGVLSSRAAVSVQISGRQDPVFGVVWFADHVDVDQTARRIRIVDVNVAKSRFPNDDPTVDRAVSDAVSQYFRGRTIELSLDQIQSTLDTIHKEQAAEDRIQVVPPTIVFVDHPAVKVQYDGDPRLVQVDNSNLLRVVNTPFFVALDPASHRYFLKGGGRWFVASDPAGPFHPAQAVPDAVSALADSSGYQDPQQALTADQLQAGVEIVTATEPTELIWTSGPPQLGTLPGTGLLYVANTDADVFLTIDSQQYYVLLSGRWYTAPRRGGPWTFVPPEQLPDDFRHISPDGPKGGVLVSVPGSDAAADAVADSYIPQTAGVDAHQFDQPPVSYDGDADFEPIEGTDLRYAVNTDASVVLAEGRYYACHDAVWYVADSAQGPWDLCLAVPREIYTIPPSCPIYPVRFVYVYGRTRDVVYYGYLPGYAGSYLYDGVVVYGTGYHYRPWVGRIYFAQPYTYGFAAQYDWYTESWGFNFALAFGGGGDWVSIGGNDRFHHDRWFGHGGFRPVYARDARHIDAARVRFDADHARAGAVRPSVYDHRGDVHRDLPHGGPAARDSARPEVDRAAADRARVAPEDRSPGREVPDRTDRRPAAEPGRSPSADDQHRVSEHDRPVAQEPSRGENPPAGEGPGAARDPRGADRRPEKVPGKSGQGQGGQGGQGNVQSPQ